MFTLYIKHCCLIALSAKKYRNKNPKVVKTKNGRIMVLSTVRPVVVKNQYLLKSKKLVVH